MASPTMRGDLEGHWVSLCGTRALDVRRTGQGVYVTVTARPSGAVLARDRPATWCPRAPDAVHSRNASRRLDRLSMELGDPGRGPTYELMFARENLAPETYDGLQWVPLEDTTPASEVRVFSQWGASFHEAVMGRFDDFVEDENALYDWVFPLVNYRRADAAPP